MASPPTPIPIRLPPELIDIIINFVPFDDSFGFYQSNLWSRWFWLGNYNFAERYCRLAYKDAWGVGKKYKTFPADVVILHRLVRNHQSASDINTNSNNDIRCNDLPRLLENRSITRSAFSCRRGFHTNPHHPNVFPIVEVAVRNRLTAALQLLLADRRSFHIDINGRLELTIVDRVPYNCTSLLWCTLPLIAIDDVVRNEDDAMPLQLGANDFPLLVTFLKTVTGFGKLAITGMISISRACCRLG